MANDFLEALFNDSPQVLFVRMADGRPVHEFREWRDGVGVMSQWNAIGWNCFFTVGVTDGSGYRRAENMVAPRALFIDLDRPETSQAALDFWIKQERCPSAIVNTSPGKYHLYWLIESGLDWATYTHYQKFLAIQTNARFGEKTADETVCDPPRIMRLPGSLHHKAAPYQGSVVSFNGRRYSLEELAAAFPKPPPPKPKLPPIPPDSRRAKWGIGEYQKLLDEVEILRLHKYGHVIICPNHKEHSDDRTEALLYEPSENNAWRGGFKCQHEHCKEWTINTVAFWAERVAKDRADRAFSEIKVRPHPTMTEYEHKGKLAAASQALIEAARARRNNDA